MPKASVYKNHCLVAGKHDVRFSGEIAYVKSVSEAASVKSFPYNEFGFGVFSADSRHHLASLFGIYDISQLFPTPLGHS